MPIDLDKLIASHKSTAKSGRSSKAFDSLLSDLEKLAEDLGQRKELDTAATDYLREKTTEIKSIRCARNWMLRLAYIMAITSLTMFYFILICPYSAIHLANISDDHARTAYVIASFASSFGLVAIIIRGIFHSGATEDGKSVLPESITALLEVVKAGK